jgi:ribose-phosphate pyrophosphokinase
MMTSRGNLTILSCESGRLFAERVVNALNEIVTQNVYSEKFRLKNTEEITFANGEIKTVINENIRGDDVYIIQLLDDPNSAKSVNDNLMSLFTAINAAYQSDAESITAVIPHFSYSRQERKKTREGITAKQIAMFIEVSGANRVITLDLHAEAIQGFFQNARMEDLHASRTLINYIKTKNHFTNPLVITGPDVGSAERARHYSKALGVEFAVVDKVRDYSKISAIESMRLVGDVEGKDVLIVDDMISTGGTLVNASKVLKEKGAEKIIALSSLPFFNGNAIEKLEKATTDKVIDKVIGTDAVFHGEAFVDQHDWYEEVSVAPLFAQVIYNINRKRSVSELLR